MSKKAKRKIHFEDNEIWYWWVASGRYSEATHITICSPSEEYVKINIEEVTGEEIPDDNEGYYFQITPSMVKEYIINNLK